MTEIAAIIGLIRALDKGDTNDGGLTISRWVRDQGERDEAAEALVRALAREALAHFRQAQIGAALLQEIDG